MKTCIIRAVRNKRVQRWAAVLLWLLIWQGMYWFVGEDLLLSSPRTVLTRLGELIVTGEFWMTVGYSDRVCGGRIAGDPAGDPDQRTRHVL